jgi:hypothetical protein
MLRIRRLTEVVMIAIALSPIFVILATAAPILSANPP